MRKRHISFDRQDEIAARRLAELQDEQAWQAHFEATADTQWDNVAALVKQEIAAELNR